MERFEAIRRNEIAFLSKKYISFILDKSYQKHGISPEESEEVFLDENLKVLPDFKYSEKEKRLIALGKTFKGKILFVVFTIRRKKIRVISARSVNKKERRYYEKN
jgi:uncharacterized DUF497 family protein